MIVSSFPSLLGNSTFSWPACLSLSFLSLLNTLALTPEAGVFFQTLDICGFCLLLVSKALCSFCFSFFTLQLNSCCDLFSTSSKPGAMFLLPLCVLPWKARGCFILVNHLIILFFAEIAVQFPCHTTIQILLPSVWSPLAGVLIICRLMIHGCAKCTIF